MEILIALLSAILPAIILIIFIYWKDKEHPEPFKMILKGFGFGCLSILLSLLFTSILSFLRPSIYDNIPIIRGIFVSFFDAALPEETAKLIMLWLLVRKSRDFDEAFDAIVYSVCIGMGFACIENIMYVFQEENWAMTALVRALLAVPGHYIDAVLMGFFYALVHFMPKKFGKYRICIWLMPFLAHGIYDSLCFVQEDLSYFAGLAVFALLYFCYCMHRFCLSRIKSILFIDKDFYDARAFEEGMRESKS